MHVCGACVGAWGGVVLRWGVIESPFVKKNSVACHLSLTPPNLGVTGLHFAAAQDIGKNYLGGD